MADFHGISSLPELKGTRLNKIVEVVEKENNEVDTIGNTFLPIKPVYSNTFAYDVIKNKQHIASYIGFGAEPPVMDRNAVASRSGELAKLGLKYIVTEQELLDIHQARQDAQRQATVNQLLAKGIDLVNAVYLQIEVSRLRALFTGAFSYDNNQVKINVDYGVTDVDTLTNTDAWTHADATPLSDLIEWNDAYVARNGKKADAIFMTRKVRASLQTNAEVIGEARGTSDATRITVDEVDDVLASYDLPPIRVVEQTSVAVHDIYSGDEQTIEYFPEGRVVFASTGVGEYQLGITVENNFNPGVVLSAYDKTEPIQSVMRSVAAGFPVIENPDLLLYRDVTTP